VKQRWEREAKQKEKELKLKEKKRKGILEGGGRQRK